MTFISLTSVPRSTRLYGVFHVFETGVRIQSDEFPQVRLGGWV